ncbi:hypothetical protein H8959_004412 [Pygathrix nigripes]
MDTLPIEPCYPAQGFNILQSLLSCQGNALRAALPIPVHQLLVEHWHCTYLLYRILNLQESTCSQVLCSYRPSSSRVGVTVLPQEGNLPPCSCTGLRLLGCV